MEITFSNILAGFLFTIGAGIATVIGAFLAFFVKKENYKMLSFGLGLSAGIMIYVSFVEIIPESIHLFEKGGFSFAQEMMLGSMALGMLIAFCIDAFLPVEMNPDEPKNQNEMQQLQSVSSLLPQKSLYRVGIVTSLVITLHNIPEGLTTFLSSLLSYEIGFVVAIALALHKIPEGFAVSLPIYYATGNKMKAFVLASFSGMANLLGAIAGYLILQFYFSEIILAVLFGIVAGIMIFVSFHQLLPTASQYNTQHIEVYGVLTGMILIGIIMAQIT